MTDNTAPVEGTDPDTDIEPVYSGYGAGTPAGAETDTDEKYAG